MDDAPANTRLGTHVDGSMAGERAYKAFVPPLLPPEPPLRLGELYGAIDEATRALSFLDASARLLPDIRPGTGCKPARIWFLHQEVRRRHPGCQARRDQSNPRIPCNDLEAAETKPSESSETTTALETPTLKQEERNESRRVHLA